MHFLDVKKKGSSGRRTQGSQRDRERERERERGVSTLIDKHGYKNKR
jgi:hypothetical protein